MFFLSKPQTPMSDRGTMGDSMHRHRCVYTHTHLHVLIHAWAHMYREARTHTRARVHAHTPLQVKASPESQLQYFLGFAFLCFWASSFVGYDGSLGFGVCLLFSDLKENSNHYIFKSILNTLLPKIQRSLQIKAFWPSRIFNLNTQASHIIAGALIFSTLFIRSTLHANHD